MPRTVHQQAIAYGTSKADRILSLSSTSSTGSPHTSCFPVSLWVVSHTKQVRQEFKLLAHSSIPLKWTEFLVLGSFSLLQRTSAMSKGIDSLADSLADKQMSGLGR
jgi:hypothetical protein